MKGTWTNKKMDGYDLSFKASIDSINSQKYNWSIEIKGPFEGGLFENEDPIMFQAPKEGYRGKYIYTIQKDNEKWSRDLRKKYYLKNAHKLYASLSINILTSKDKTIFLSIESIINNEFLPNLEYLSLKTKDDYNNFIGVQREKYMKLMENNK